MATTTCFLPFGIDKTSISLVFLSTGFRDALCYFGVTLVLLFLRPNEGNEDFEGNEGVCKSLTMSQLLQDKAVTKNGSSTFAT